MKTLRLYLAALAVLGCSKSQPAAVPRSRPRASPSRPRLRLRRGAPRSIPGRPGKRCRTPSSPDTAAAHSTSLTSYLKTIPTTGLVVTVHGRVLYSYGDLLEESYLASARKSVLSMLYGNYVTQGRIKLSSTLAELGIDDRPPLTAGEKQATVEGPAHDELRRLSPRPRIRATTSVTPRPGAARSPARISSTATGTSTSWARSSRRPRSGTSTTRWKSTWPAPSAWRTGAGISSRRAGTRPDRSTSPITCGFRPATWPGWATSCCGKGSGRTSR